jgi:hypothetical protein
MPPRDIVEALRRRPFVPFRLHLSDGTVYEIRHPELVMVGLGSLVVGFPSGDEPDPLYERYTTVALSHIVGLEPMQVDSPA